MIRKLLSTTAILLCVLFVQAQGNYTVADKQYETGEYLQALQSYLKEGRGNKHTYLSSIQIARCYDKLGLSSKAFKWYQRAKSINHTDYAHSLEMGKSEMRQGQYQDAMVSFNNYAFIDSDISLHYLDMVTNVSNITADKSNTYTAEALNNNNITNEFGPIVYKGQLYFNTDVKNTSLDIDAKKTLGHSASIITCNEANEPLLKGKFTIANIAPISIAGSGTIAYSSFTSQCKAFDSRRANNTLYIGTLDQHRIIDAKPFPFNKIGYSITDPFLMDNGNTLYFSSNMPGGFGGYDLYYSQWSNGTWSQPMNLGGNINTIGNEITPTVDNNNTLYFASDYHLGLGGYDIFTAEWNINEWNGVTNAGLGINSSENDYYPTVDPNTNKLYFTSTRQSGSGGEDIYSAQLRGQLLTVVTSQPEAIAVADTEAEQPIELEDDIEFDIPAAVYVGDYQRDRSVTQANAIGKKLTKFLPISWSIEMNHVDVPEIEHIPNQDVADMDTPPAFKLPSFESEQPNNGTLVSYDGARLVSIGSVIAKPISSVFFIQLAAFYSSKGEMNKFQPLSSYGNIYKVFAGSAVKVRLGYFHDKMDATQILSRVKSMGYKDAFIVNEDLNTSNMELIYSNFDQNTSITSSSEGDKAEDSSNNFEYSKPIDKIEGQEYKIRLASYEDPIWFDSSKIKDLGQLEQWSKGSWTIFILSGFDSFEEAEATRIKAINRGYADAEVVIDNQGIIERLKTN